MLVSDFHFDLPEELIAQTPPAERDGARMMALDRATGAVADCMFLDLPSMLRAGDLLVLNDSRVVPARLYAKRAGLRAQSAAQQPAGRIEVLLTQQKSAWDWAALVRPGRKVQVGERLLFAAEDGTALLEAEVAEHGGFGERLLRFVPVEDFYGALDRVGHMPLPPYIHRDDRTSDRERYQTVFAKDRGSAAAPTAGLHFTPRIFEQLRAKGVEISHVTLHVGLGTFQPLRSDRVEQIRLHAERYTLPQSTADAVNAAMRDGRRVIAAGTTTVRTLEHCALMANGSPLGAHSGETSIFIAPGVAEGKQFRLVQGMLTNFHLPQSSLLMLVCAFAGREQVLAAYGRAVAERYRFFSYGDCMFIA